eukprot:6167891-Pleurochrysis_carterae.AAC.1
MASIAVCTEAFLACNVLCKCCFCGWRVACALWEQFYDFCAAVIESCVQEFGGHGCPVRCLSVGLSYHSWWCGSCVVSDGYH